MSDVFISALGHRINFLYSSEYGSETPEGTSLCSIGMHFAHNGLGLPDNIDVPQISLQEVCHGHIKRKTSTHYPTKRRGRI